MSTKRQQRLTATHQRIAALKAGLIDFDYVCSGTLLRRMLACGNPTCRCKRDPAKRHGPYYYWGRRTGGRLVQMLLAPDEAQIIKYAIRQFRRIQGTLRKLEAETVHVIEIHRRFKG